MITHRQQRKNLRAAYTAGQRERKASMGSPEDRQRVNLEQAARAEELARLDKVIHIGDTCRAVKTALLKKRIAARQAQLQSLTGADGRGPRYNALVEAQQRDLEELETI